MSGPATLDDLRQMVFARVRKVERAFTSPVDDWPMAMFVQNADGVESMPLRNEWFASGRTKDLLGEVLKQAMVVSGVFRYALLINTHASEDVSDEQVERIRRDELRVEQVEGAWEQLVLVVGDAETEEAWKAMIGRSARMLRTLGRWERMDAGDEVAISGRFAGLNAYLRRL